MLNSLPNYQTIGPIRNFSILLAILFASYASVWLLGETPWLTALTLILPAFIFLFYVRSFKLLVVMLIAAILGTGHEAFFVAEGYWSYSTPSWFGVPAYLPAVWAVIGMLSAALYKGLLSMTHVLPFPHRVPRSHSALGFTLVGFTLVGFTLVGFTLVFTAILLFAPTPLTLIGCFIAIEALYIACMRSLPLALVGLFTLAAGTIADLFFVHLGTWSYPTTTVSWFGIPLYIFAYWNIMGVLLAGLYASLDAKPSQPSEMLLNSQSPPSSH